MECTAVIFQYQILSECFCVLVCNYSASTQYIKMLQKPHVLPKISCALSIRLSKCHIDEVLEYMTVVDLVHRINGWTQLP